MTRAISRLAARRTSIAVFAIAACSIVEAGAQDLAVTAVTAPASGCALSLAESVTVQLFNYGPTLTAGSTFNVSYTVNAGAPLTEMVTLGSNLLANGRLVYTFTTPADLSVPGNYTIDATANLPGDINPTNNVYSGYAVTNWANSVGGTLATPPMGSAGTLSLSGHIGNVVQWEESDDNGARWFALANTTATQAYARLRVPTRFRARVRNGPCADALSSPVTAVP